MAVTKKNKITLPPKFPTDSEAMRRMINKGGSASVISEVSENDELKSFTIKIYESELAKIRQIVSRASKRDQVSMRTFITSAVLEKIASEY